MRILILVYVGLLVGGCKDPPASPPSPPLVSTASVAVGADWSERLRLYRARSLGPKYTPQGPLTTLDRLHDERPTVFAFWATYCPPCIEEMPMFDRLHHAGHRIVGVGMDSGDFSEVQAILKRQAVTYPQVVLDAPSTRAAGRALEAGLPFTLVTRPDKAVKTAFSGKVTEAEIKAVLE